MATRVAALMLSAVILVGCGHAAVTSRGTPRPPGPGVDRTGVGIGPGAQRPNDLPRSDTGAVMRGAGRTICRTRGVPRGFVAVDYVQSASCGVSGDSTRVYNAAVIVDITRRLIGDVIVICAGQIPPTGWSRTGAAPDSRQCPRDPRDKTTYSTVIEIVKVG